jgi:2-methylcitrate dehydratase PrpD
MPPGEQSTPLTLAQQLAARLVEMRSAALPDDVLERAKMCILDQLGIQIRGATLPHVQAAAKVAESLGGLPESSLPMTDVRLPAPYAAFVAATFGHSCEFDDSHFLCGHPGTCVIPTVLAVAEPHHASGRAVLSALVAGYEGMILSVGPIHPTTMATGWHGTKVGGVFGAAAATAALIELDESATAHALAIAGSDASGTCEYDRSGGEVKRVHPGMAARSGIEAALLARAGLTGPLTIFEGIRGIYRLFGDGSDAKIDAVWSRQFHIRDVMYKLYPAVGTHQAPLDALRYLMASEAVTAEDVEWISVSTAPWAILHGGATGEPADMISAQFNLGFSLALRLLKKSNALPLYADPAMWRDPEVRALSQLIRVQGISFAPGESELGGLVEVGLRDGRVASRREHAFRGHPSNPARPSDIQEKFVDLVGGLLPSGRASQIIDTVWRLDQIADITELTTLLRP